MAIDNMPTKVQIAEELIALGKLKNKIPEYSLFGDNNWENAEVAARVITEHMDEDDIDKLWSEEACEHEGEDFSQSRYDAARDTLNWLNGEEDEPWSEGWN